MAAELKAIASLDGKPFESGMRRVTKQTDTFASKLGSMKGLIAGAFTVGAFTAFSRKMLTMADDLNTAAATVGITMESMLGLKSAMAESGISADRMLKILSRLPIAQGDVQRGLKTMTDSLKDLNISEAEFLSLKPDRLIERMARAYVDAGKSQAAFNAIAKIFGGRIGPEMIEVMERINKDGLDAFIDKSKGAALGATKLAQASDKIESVWEKITQWVMRSAGFMIEAAEFYAAMAGKISAGEGFTEAARNARDEILAARAGKSGDPLGGEGGGGGGDVHADAYDDAYFNKREQALLREMTIAEKIAYFEKERASLEKARLGGDYSKGLHVKILDVEEKILKVKEEQAKVEQRIAEKEQQRIEILADRDMKIAEIMAGKGVGAPSMARVDSLQQIGGIVGGVAGAGDQRARILERQAKTSEMIKDLTEDSIRKLQDIEERIKELNEG